MAKLEVIGVRVPTSLDKVRDLNYDHHRRMTELHNMRLAAGEAGVQGNVDDQSYRNLLRDVPRNRSRIIELGSASGGQWKLLREWSPRGEISGIDLYEPLVVQAQAQGLSVFLGFVEEMTMFQDGEADLVCSRHVMEHLGDVDRGMSEIRRILQSGGFSAHVTPDMAGDNEPAHLNHLNKDEWASRWASHGFDIISSDKLPFNGGEVHLVCQKR
jgi:trans-aconitate methyltransferase